MISRVLNTYNGSIGLMCKQGLRSRADLAARRFEASRAPGCQEGFVVSPIFGSRRAWGVGGILLLVVAGAYADAPSLRADRVVNVSLGPGERYDEDVIVYTASQSWNSRIYLLRPNGSVIRYFEYEFYRFADLEVVNNEIYAAEAFAPRLLKIDMDTGDLEVIIDDWSLYYFYDVAFDGQSFYVNEWDLNRYTIDGTKTGTASFDGSVWGGAWDGTYYWTVTDENLIKCWDLSQWPTVTELPDNAIIPPSANCRGLWFDGERFWTAESVEGALGYIYRFDHDGQVNDQWLEPAFQGWGACIIRNIPGDMDDDGHVDLDDYARFAPCLGGPGVTTPPINCDPDDFPEADLDGDTDVDLLDFLEFGAVFGSG